MRSGCVNAQGLEVLDVLLGQNHDISLDRRVYFAKLSLRFALTHRGRDLVYGALSVELTTAAATAAHSPSAAREGAPPLARTNSDVPRRLVIVESPAKAKTIAGYLGIRYVVESSFGHIRDLPSKKTEVPAAQR